MSEVPALYGQYDDEGNPLWMDKAVRQLLALRAENERLKEALKAAKTWLTGWASAEKELAIIDAALKSGDIRAALPAETGTPLEKHGISEE